MQITNILLSLAMVALIIMSGLAVWYSCLSRDWERCYWEQVEQSQKERLAYGHDMFQEGLEQGKKLGGSKITQKLENDEV